MFEHLHSWSLVYYFSEWLIRLVMLVYVPQRRSPAAARAWLLFIFILPWPGLILYAIFGRAYLSQRRQRLQAQVMERLRTAGSKFLPAPLDFLKLPPEVRSTAVLVANLGRFGPVDGNCLELLSEYDAAIDRLVGDIDQARQHVHLLYYIFADDHVALRVADALARAIQRGVKCRVLIDSLGSKKWAPRLVARLTASKIEVYQLLPYRWFRPNPARIDLRNHRKIAVIDGRIGYVGSQNLVDSTFKPGICYEELVVRAEGPVVGQLQAVFLADHYFETEQMGSDPGLFPAMDPVGPSEAQVLPSGPGFPQANNQRLFVSLIHAARKRVVVTTPYFIPDEGLLQALEIAVQRGVDVRLIVSKTADQVLVGLAQRSYYEQLLEVGVHLYLYREKFLHAKHLSIDESIAVIGSSNMDLRSFLLNAEVSMVIYDPQVVRRLNAIQEHYFAGSELLTAEEWRRRPLPVRVLQNIARLVDSLL